MVYAKPGTHDFVVVLDNLKPSFNIGKIFRSADAFGVNQIHLINIEYFSTKSAKGSFKWVPAVFHKDFHRCYQTLVTAGYTFFILDPAAQTPLTDVVLPKKSAFIFGHEEHGFSFDPKDYSAIHAIRVPQFGKVENLNVSIAASVVMYECIRQHSHDK